MTTGPKAAIRCAYLCGRRGVRWPLAWFRARAIWDGHAAWNACSASWNAGRQAAGMEPIRLLP